MKKIFLNYIIQEKKRNIGFLLVCMLGGNSLAFSILLSVSFNLHFFFFFLRLNYLPLVVVQFYEILFFVYITKEFAPF